MKKILLISALLISSLAASAQKNTVQSYIDKFKDDAIRIMNETGVPASIVLGVAMHESACGNSAIAQNLNNQFGVKGGYTSVYYKHKKKIKSAYKHYDTIDDSFDDFARIISNRKQFNGLSCELTQYDYVGWAKGIAKSGYASSRTWSKQVLGLIEKYKLYNFDQPQTTTAPSPILQAATDPAQPVSPPWANNQ